MDRAVIFGDLERRHLMHRVLHPVRIRELIAFEDVDDHVLERQPLDVEPDPHAMTRRRAPIVMENDLHGATTCSSMAPNRFGVAWMWMRSPTAMNGVVGLPPSIVSIIRASARHEMPRARSRFETVPLPRIVPAANRRVFAMCWTSSKNEKCISGPASQSPTCLPLYVEVTRTCARPPCHASPSSSGVTAHGENAVAGLLLKNPKLFASSSGTRLRNVQSFASITSFTQSAASLTFVPIGVSPSTTQTS